MELTPSVLSEANVNPGTRLATDYLNVFNEAVMLIGLVADDPDMLDELIDWSAPSYVDHFKHSQFQGKEVVLAAYEAADADRRRSFDARAKALAAAINAEIAVLCEHKKSATLSDELVVDVVAFLNKFVERLDGLIHTRAPDTEARDAVDALFGD